MNKAWALLAALTMTALAGCVEDTSTDAGVPDGTNTAVICSNLGAISIELYTEKTPAHAKNFLELAKKDYYDDVTFHRIISGFMMQGGDPQGTGSGGETWDGSKLPDETRNDLKHDRAGLLSMANRGADPSTGSSQFFITFAATPWLDGKHVIFGEVTDGLDVVKAIEEQAATQGGQPKVDVFMQDVLVGEDASNCPEAAGIPEPEPAKLAIGAITPGQWRVTSTEESLLFWATNEGDVAGDVTWSATTPEGWSLSFDKQTLNVAGQSAAHTMARLTVPSGASGDHVITVSSGNMSLEITATVALDNDPITKEGDQVTVNYRGYCTGDGADFDSGEFPTTLGSGQTIPGFDLGLVGVAVNEPVTLVIPDAMAYGDSPRDPCANVDPQGLSFDVSITSIG